MVSVGSCFWGDQNRKCLFSKASKYPLKLTHHISTGWDKPIENKVGNKPIHTLFWVTKLFQIRVFKQTFFGFRKKPICP